MSRLPGEIALVAHLGQRREAILEAWRDAVRADPTLTTAATLPRVQLHDHIPALLDIFERKLGSAGAEESERADAQHTANAAAHGLHRWQQGYDLREVTRELAKLNECMVAELEAYAMRPGVDPASMARARCLWASLCGRAIGESTAKFFELRQVEAASHVTDLESAMLNLQELEQQRAILWQQAAHDLRGNLGVVSNATTGLTLSTRGEPVRSTFLALLRRNVVSLHGLLDDVTSLARLQAGHEQRRIAAVDAAALLRELCEDLRAQADERKLWLSFDGPAALLVDADTIKVRRIAQNLIMNAIKYTQKGGVSVSWGEPATGDDQRWQFSVQDTGPGYRAGPGTPLARALESATGYARQVAADDHAQQVSHAIEPLTVAAAERDDRPVHQEIGEGIGLSIVKQLCDLLDASVEVESAKDVGTTFRVSLPRRYAN